MAYYDEPLVDPSLDFDAQQAALDQQAARIKALRQNYGQPYKPDLQEVGGFTLSTGQRIPGRVIGGWGSALSALAPLVADYTAGQQEKNLNQQRSDYDKRVRADAAAQIANFPKATEGYYSPLPGNTGGTGGNLVEATYTPGKEPTQAELLAAYNQMMTNPQLRKAGGEAMEYGLTKAPGEALTRTLAAEEKRRAQFNADRTFMETHNYHQALLNKPPGGQAQDTGKTDDKGAKIFAYPDGRAYSFNYPLLQDGSMSLPPALQSPAQPARSPSTANSPGVTPFTPPNARGNTNPALREPGVAQSPPAALDDATRKSVEAQGASMSALQDLRARRANLKPSIIADVAPTVVGKSKIVAALDPAAAERAGWYSDYQDYVNKQLYEASGKAINKEEMVRLRETMPNAASTDEEWERWFTRAEAALQTGINRTQALGTHPKDYYLDPKVNAVIDRNTGQIVPGTESPFAQEIATQRAVTEYVRKNGEPYIGNTANMETMKADIAAMPESLEKALAERALKNGARGPSTPPAPKKPSALPKSNPPAQATAQPSGGAKPHDALSVVEDGYRYTPGPGGRGNKANWSKVP